MLKNTAIVEKLNICVLIAGIVMLIAIFPHKQISYDEPFSIMCSKGITNFSLANLKSPDTITSAEISAQNTYHNVFQGGDSFYYIGLHYFAGLFNNTLKSYVIFSLVWAILALTAFYFLCKTILGDSPFTALAIVIFVTDVQVLNITYLIRPYTMGLCLIVVSGIFFFRYLLHKNSPANLLMLGLFGVFAVLTHYFTVYIVIAYALLLLYNEKLALFSKKNLLAILVPFGVLAVYFVLHRPLATSYNTYQNYTKDGLHLKMYVSLAQAVSSAIRTIAIDFKALYPLLKDTLPVRLAAFLLIVFVYVYGFAKVITNPADRRKYHLLFILGVSSSIFLGTLSFSMNNIMLFNFRYFVFSFPFCCVFVALFLCSLAENNTVNLTIKVALIVLLLFPGFYKLAKKGFDNDGFPCNHIEVVQNIIRNDVHTVEVPGLTDAIFLNCFLPSGYQLTYKLNPKSNNFTIYKKDNAEQIPVINSGLLALY